MRQEEIGFVGWLRSEAAGVAELQYLVRQTAELRAGPPRTEARGAVEPGDRGDVRGVA